MTPPTALPKEVKVRDDHFLYNSDVDSDEDANDAVDLSTILMVSSDVEEEEEEEWRSDLDSEEEIGSIESSYSNEDIESMLMDCFEDDAAGVEEEYGLMKLFLEVDSLGGIFSEATSDWATWPSSVG